MRQTILALGTIAVSLLAACSPSSPPPLTDKPEVTDPQEVTEVAVVASDLRTITLADGSRTFFDDSRPLEFPAVTDDPALAWAMEHHDRVYKEYAALAAEHRRLRREAQHLRRLASTARREGRPDEARAHETDSRRNALEADRLEERLDPMRDEVGKASDAVKEINERSEAVESEDQR